MADIFLSYNEQDREVVRRLARALESLGWSVWWDRRIPAGMTWRSLLEQELQSMRCMLVLWSSHSVKSEWVCEEATEGRLLGRLIPVKIEEVRPPAGFREVQAANLVGWDGTADFLGWRELVTDLEGKLGAPATPQTSSTTLPVTAPAPTATPAAPPIPPAVPAPPPSPKPQPGLRKAWWLAVGVLLLGLLLPWVLPAWRQHAPPTSPMAEHPEPTTTITAITPPVPGPVLLPDAPASAIATATPPNPTEPKDSAATKPPVVAATGLTPKPKSKPAAASNPRCSALRERQELGDTLSAESLLFLKKEC